MTQPARKRSATFGARCLEARMQLAADLGQEISGADIARQIGKTPTTYNRYERDEKMPKTGKDRVSLAMALNCDPGWLFTDPRKPQVECPHCHQTMPERYAGSAGKAKRGRGVKVRRRHLAVMPSAMPATFYGEDAFEVYGVPRSPTSPRAATR